MSKVSLSDDHSFIAFGVDLANDENLSFFFKDLKKKSIKKIQIEQCKVTKLKKRFKHQIWG